MTKVLINEDNTTTVLSGQPFTIGEFSYPGNWVFLATPEELAERNIKDLVDVGPMIPGGHRLVSSAIQVVEGSPTMVYQYEAIPFADLKASKLVDLETVYTNRIIGGFPHTFTVDDVDYEETLQCRNETDRTNWLGLKDSCNDAILAGLGDTVCPLSVRTTSNTNYQLTFSEIATLMRDLRTWVSTTMGVYWAKKDAIGAAANQTQLDAINLQTGWP